MKTIRKLRNLFALITILFGVIMIGTLLNEAVGGKPVDMNLLRVLFWGEVVSIAGLFITFSINLLFGGGNNEGN